MVRETLKSSTASDLFNCILEKLQRLNGNVRLQQTINPMDSFDSHRNIDIVQKLL